MRRALEEAQATTPQAEWAALAPVVAELEKGAAPARAGRPKTAKREVLSQVSLPGGVKLRGERCGSAFVIHMEGRGVDAALLDRAIARLQETLTEEEH